MSLAAKLPYDHPFAGGYPRIGGQPLPTDPDAIDYLQRLSAVEGAAVEQGVAMAVDAFVKGCKADGIWDAIKDSCIICGARTISGALVPLKGAAPTNVADGFVSGDYSRTGGLRDPGGTSSLSVADLSTFSHTTNHFAVFCSTLPTVQNASLWFTASGSGVFSRCQYFDGTKYVWNMSSTNVSRGTAHAGFVGNARNDSSSTVIERSNSVTDEFAQSSSAASVGTLGVISGDPEVAFYSFGDYVDLADLDNRVSTLIAAIAAALS